MGRWLVERPPKLGDCDDGIGGHEWDKKTAKPASV